MGGFGEEEGDIRERKFPDGREKGPGDLLTVAAVTSAGSVPHGDVA